MTAQPPAGSDDGSAHPSPASLHETVRRFADTARAAAATAQSEAKAHSLETVTGAFGVGYLIGRALFGRKR